MEYNPVVASGRWWHIGAESPGKRPKMPDHESAWEDVSRISVDPQPAGLKAVYLIETASETEKDAILQIFEELAVYVQVRKLCEGRLVGFVVQADESQSCLLDELDEMLRRECTVLIAHRLFDEIVYKIIRELADETGSRSVDVPSCDSCGVLEPFPALVVNLADEHGGILRSRCFCAACAASASSRSHKDFLMSLMAADKPCLRSFADAHLLKHRAGEHSVRFRIRR